MLPEDTDSSQQPPWLLTFADLMMLLLTMFVLLVSMSELKRDDRFQGIADSLEQQFGKDLLHAPQDSAETRDPALAAILQATQQWRRELFSKLQGTELLQLTFSASDSALTTEHQQALSAAASNARPTERLELHATASRDERLLFERLQTVLTALESLWQIPAERIRVVIHPAESPPQLPEGTIAIKVQDGSELANTDSPRALWR